MRVAIVGVALAALGCGQGHGGVSSTDAAPPIFDGPPGLADVDVGSDGAATFSDGLAGISDAPLASDGPASPDDAARLDAAVPPTIQQFQTPDTKDRGCLTSTDPSMVRQVQGTLDLALDKNYPYLLFPLLSLPANAAMVQLNAFRVRIGFPAGATVTWPADCPAEFDYPFNIELAPGGTAAGSVAALQSCHAAKLRELFVTGALDARLQTKVMINLTITSRAYAGSQLIFSSPADFPIRVCMGCLQTGFPAPYDVYSYPKVPLCTQLTTNPFLGNPCNPAQDFGPLLCCSKDAEGKMLECPGIPRGMVTPPAP